MLKSMFADKEFTKPLWRLSIPILIQHLMLALVATSDAFMLGGLDQNSMSAVSLATQVQFVQNMVMGAAVSTTSILGAQYYGKRDMKAIGMIFCIGLRIAGAISVLSFAACFFFPRAMMLLFTNEEALIEIGIRYLRIAAWSYLLTGISQCYLVVLKITDHAAEAAKISTAAVLINIALNAILIFGLFGFPMLSVRGAAIATLAARVIELVWCVAASFKKDHLHPELSGLFRRNPVLSKDFIHCMLPLLGASLLWGVGFTSYTSFMGHMGTDAAAANSVASVVRDLTCCLGDGFAAGGGILVGNQLGAGEIEKGRLYGDRLALLAFIFGAISCLLMFAALPPLLGFIHLTEGARKDLVAMMIIMAVYMIGRTVNTIVINGIFVAGGDTLFDMYSLIVTMWCIAVPLAVLGTFVFHWPVAVVYACTCLDEVGKIPWVMIHYKKYKWAKNLTRPETGSDA